MVLLVYAYAVFECLSVKVGGLFVGQRWLRFWFVVILVCAVGFIFLVRCLGCCNYCLWWLPLLCGLGAVEAGGCVCWVCVLIAIVVAS